MRPLARVSSLVLGLQFESLITAPGLYWFLSCLMTTDVDVKLELPIKHLATVLPHLIFFLDVCLCKIQHSFNLPVIITGTDARAFDVLFDLLRLFSAVFFILAGFKSHIFSDWTFELCFNLQELH